jgi:hypothetical protein
MLIPELIVKEEHMALSPDSDKETVCYVLTKEQAKRVRALAELRSTPHRTVALSEVAREVVAAGLEAILRADHGSFGSSTDTVKAA